MKSKLVLAVMAAALIVGVAFVAQAQATKNLAGAYNRVALDGDENYVKSNPVSSVSVTNVATTTLSVITAATNRDRLIIKVNATDTANAVWVNLGGSVATVSSGIRVDYYSPLDIELSDDVAAAMIASTAAPAVVIQTVRE